MKDYKKYYIIPASPEEVYAALTNPITLQLWTGDKAEMSTEPDSEFSWFDGDIVGKNLEFEENRMLVQEWYFGNQQDRSIVTIKLHPHKAGTSAELRHINIPDEAFDDITEGWNHNFFASLIEFYED